MSITNSLAVALALTMLWNTPGHAQCASDPAKVAKTLYTQHHDFYLEDPKALSALVAPRLLMSLKLEHACPQGELCAIEAVPWTDAQDGEIVEPIYFKTVEQTAMNAVVEMRYTFVLDKSDQRQQQIHLVFERSKLSACWLLSDLVGSRGNSLVDEIERWHKEFRNGL